MPKVLVVEDDSSWQEYYEKKLTDFELIQAETWDDGKLLFEENAASLDAIVMDGRLHGLPGDVLAGIIRAAGYAGPMIAASAGSQDRLLKSGCDHEAIKPDVPDLLKKLLL